MVFILNLWHGSITQPVVKIGIFFLYSYQFSALNRNFLLVYHIILSAFCRLYLRGQVLYVIIPNILRNESVGCDE